MKYEKMNSSDDVASIMDYYREIFWEEPNYDGKDFYESVDGTSQYPYIEYFKVFNDEGDCVGFCGLEAENGTEVWLGWFGIRPSYRRRGYARAMLRMLLEKATARGYSFCRVYTDKVIDNNAYRLYESEGFFEDSQCGYNFVTMVKSLDGRTPPKWVGMPCGFESEPPK